MLLLHITSFESPVSQSESELLEMYIKRISQQDDLAFAELYKLTKDSVYAFALTILKNTHDAEDAMHDCYINIHRGAGSYRSDGKPLAWILTITKNICLGKLRKNKNMADLPEEDWEKFLDNKEGISIEDKLVIRACMETLSDEEREIVILHAVSGFKHREIANILDMGLSTVLSKYNRAIKKLKKQLEESGNL